MELSNRSDDISIDFRKYAFIDDETNSLKSKVSSSPLKSGGANFTTHVLIEESSSKILYKPSIGVAFFNFAFLAVGLGVLFFGLYPLLNNGFDFAEIEWFLLLFGLIFATAGGLMFYFFYMPRIFDKQLGIYYKAYKIDVNTIRKDTSKKYIPLKSIIAIQIIGEHVKSDKGSYKSFELNLVLKDATRKNIIDHGNLKAIIIDAEILSQFLNIPIWHAGSIED
ncbi:hypothetical protein [Winogradskyella forsetii]|uniref:hypothetical protein n=1 Tax=Winogradskyella forsetii TaxID=2686077 RepID=UPI0015BEA3E6|nr:hypothetical protein [Winogradskyella forsetii]